MRVIGPTTLPPALVALLSAGCMTAALSAPRARVPILIGPVACIGCAAAPPPAVSDPAPIQDGATQYSMSGVNEMPATSGGRYAKLDTKAEAAVPDPCRGEVRLSRVSATAFGAAF